MSPSALQSSARPGWFARATSLDRRQSVQQFSIVLGGGHAVPASAAIGIGFGQAAPRALGERLRGAMLWLTAFSGALVFVEPGPYEVMTLLTLVVFAIHGLTLRGSLMPLVLMLALCNIGFSFSVIPVLEDRQAATWVLISWYLSATAAFYAGMLGQHLERRLDLVIRGTMAAATIAALAGLAGYFNLMPGISELFVLYGRARGTFNDPNVLGAFLVLPALIASQRVLLGGSRDVLIGTVLLVLFVVALLLSFSRAAWGQLAGSGLVMLALTFVTSRSATERLRITLAAIVGALLLVLVVVALLSVSQVSDLFWERASLEQSYDVGPLGRFGRQQLGSIMVLDHPLGIGPLQFAKSFTEDPHNAYLDAFLSGGWISGLAYAAMMVATLLAGLRFVFVAAPWQRTYVALYAAFVGIFFESFIIDSNHWRHYFLIVGLLWGLMAAARPYVGVPSRRA
jgi:O-antigen ligase